MLALTLTATGAYDEAAALARELLQLGPRTVVMKLGEQGSVCVDGDGEIHAPGFAVEARDTTAAGDVFNAALAVALAEAEDARVLQEAAHDRAYGDRVAEARHARLRCPHRRRAAEVRQVGVRP